MKILSKYRYLFISGLVVFAYSVVSGLVFHERIRLAEALTLMYVLNIWLKLED